MTQKVSIIIPTTGDRISLLKAIESALNQQSVNLEVIVIVDTNIILQEILQKIPEEVKLYFNTGIKGGNACRNLGAKYASNSILAFLDDDDEWVENKLKEQLAVLKYNPNIDLVYTGKIIYIVDNDKIISERYSYSYPLNINLTLSIAYKNFIGTTSSIVIKKSSFFKIGGFNVKLMSMQDYEFYVRMILFGMTAKGIDKALTKYYVHKGKKSTSKNIKNNFNSSISIMKIFDSGILKSIFFIRGVLFYNIKTFIRKYISF